MLYAARARTLSSLGGLWRCSSGGSRAFLSELDHVRQSRKVAKLQVLFARDVVRRPDRGKHLRLFDGIDTQIGLEIEIEVEHLLRVTGLFGNDVEYLLLD